MSERSDLADWLRAVAQLKPVGDDGLEAIARLLGLRLTATGKAGAVVPRRKPAAGQRDAESGPSAREQPIPESKPRRRLESVLIPGTASRNPAPRWLAAARLLGTTDPAHIRPAIPLEPLFPTRTSRAILSGALATPSASGPLHLARVIELLSRAEVIHEIPRISIPTLARGVQLLIDCGEAMQPFAADQAALRAALVSVAGRDRSDVLYFDGSPLWGAGTGSKDAWPEYRTPAPGTPVVVLTDLGIGQPPGVAGLAGVSDWREFAGTLARARCPLLALVPYPPRRWPTALSRSMTIVQWDRATTASVIRRAVPVGLRAAEPTRSTPT
jgi:hypothetical protein